MEINYINFTFRTYISASLWVALCKLQKFHRPFPWSQYDCLDSHQKLRTLPDKLIMELGDWWVGLVCRDPIFQYVTAPSRASIVSPTPWYPSPPLNINIHSVFSPQTLVIEPLCSTDASNILTKACYNTVTPCSIYILLTMCNTCQGLVKCGCLQFIAQCNSTRFWEQPPTQRCCIRMGCQPIMKFLIWCTVSLRDKKFPPNNRSSLQISPGLYIKKLI